MRKGPGWALPGLSGPRRRPFKQALPAWTFGPWRRTVKMDRMEYLVIAFFFGLATGFVAKGKGSSFWIWFVIGAVIPLLGLVAAILYRVEKNEPERQCPNCHKELKLYVQVCPRCGTDLYLPDPAAVRHPGVSEGAGRPPFELVAPRPMGVSLRMSERDLKVARRQIAFRVLRTHSNGGRPAPSNHPRD